MCRSMVWTFGESKVSQVETGSGIIVHAFRGNSLEDTRIQNTPGPNDLRKFTEEGNIG